MFALWRGMKSVEPIYYAKYAPKGFGAMRCWYDTHFCMIEGLMIVLPQVGARNKRRESGAVRFLHL